MNTGEWIQIGVAVVLTLTLGAVLWYAWEARKQAKASARMAEEMRQQRLIGLQPIVVPSALSVTTSCIAATLANVGSGPSFDLSFYLRSLDRGKEVDQGGGVQVLKPGEDVRVEFRPQGVFDEKWEPDTGQSILVFPPGQYTLVASYDDLYGNHLSAVRPLELREWHTERGAGLQGHLGRMRFSGYDVLPPGSGS